MSYLQYLLLLPIGIFSVIAKIAAIGFARHIARLISGLAGPYRAEIKEGVVFTAFVFAYCACAIAGLIWVGGFNG